MKVWLSVGLVVGLATGALSACGGDDTPSETAEGSTSSSTAPTTSTSTTADPPTSTTTGTETTGTEADTSGGSTDPTTTGSGTTTPTSEGTTIAESSDSSGTSAICGIEDAMDPYFILSHQAEELLETDQSFLLECGFQGSFMLEFTVELGGVEPDGEFVDFTLTMDVEGFNLGPTGHYYAEDIYGLYVGCDKVVGGVSALNRIFIVPPDEIADVTAMDGAAVTFSVTMIADDGTELPFVSTGTMVAVETKQWQFCQG